MFALSSNGVSRTAGHEPICLQRALVTRLLCCTSVLLCVCGCSEDEPPLYPVRGALVYKGKSIPKAELVLHPLFEGPGWMPVAVVDENGSSAASTRLPGDGALAGRYKLTVVWRPTVNEDGESPNLLPARYADAKTSNLEIDVGPGSSNLPPIHLTD